MLDRMLDHDQWATGELLDVSVGLTDAQLDQAFDIGHTSVRATLVHLVKNVGSWAAYLTALADGQEAVWPRRDERKLSIAELIALHKPSSDAFIGVARRLREEGRFEETYADRYGIRKSLGGTLLMVIEHNAVHRSEVCHMLGRLDGIEAPEVDYGVWDYLEYNPTNPT